MMPPHRTRAAALATALLLSATAGAAGESPDDPYAIVHGMTISCPGAGRIWGTDEMVEAMRELKELGVNWITIHPYAPIRGDGTVGGGGMEQMYDDPVWITRPIREAHALGMKIMIKPHLAYWGSPFAWRGEIHFDTEARWGRFFEGYERWITRVAELSREADAFVVGTELDQTLDHEAAWRRIIAAVRARTTAPLTYSANWASYERVPFWDELDVIGIQAYFPLVSHDGLPTEQELDDAWGSLMERLEDYATRHNRRIVFGELGYNRSAAAALRPWDYKQGGEEALEVQRRCLTAALKALRGSKAVVGAFLWKWFPDEGRGRRNFLKSTPEMREVIARFWREQSSP